MSNSTYVPAPGVVISEYPAFQLEEYCDAAVLTLAVFEHLITFGREYRFFWRRKVTGASLLFAMNRYIFLLNNILGAVYWAPLTTRSCALMASASSNVGDLQYLPWATFAGLRTFALSRSYVLGTFVLLLSLVPFTLKYARFFLWKVRGEVDPTFGCGEVENSNAQQGHIFDICIRVSFIVAEVIVIFVTWYTTYRRGTFRQRGLTLTNIVLLDGTTYFFAMMLLNILDLVFSLATIGPNTAIQFSSLVTTFIEPITSILVSRFLLDLQAAKHSNGDGTVFTAESSDAATTLNFARVVGSLDASLEPRMPGGDGNEDEDWLYSPHTRVAGAEMAGAATCVENEETESPSSPFHDIRRVEKSSMSG